ncbi:MAG: hypothetical protein JOY64_23175 [Alphaproteobacteria bacterium]|nr:hypothetical protein [Alphaproteobacteria bacterium]MBV8410548.1 hypothetical protein [Alphaproteobacteria bacterium]
MDVHEALFVAVVALAMAADVVKKHLAWDPFSLPLSPEGWTLQPPCLDPSAALGCILTLSG